MAKTIKDPRFPADHPRQGQPKPEAKPEAEK